MGASSNLLLSLILSVILLSGIASFQPFAFADDEPKTLESECAEELEDDDLDLEGLFCLAILSTQQAITQIQNQIGDFTVDSFFDIIYRITVPSCPDDQRPTLNAENNGYTCVPRASFDSFFDIVVDTKAQVDTIETEIVALQLVSHEPLTVEDIQGFGFELGPHTDLGTIPAEILALQLVSHEPLTVADIEGFGFFQGPHYTDAQAIAAVGPHTPDTNAETLCGSGQLLDGDGNCVSISSGGISCENEIAINAVIPAFVFTLECNPILKQLRADLESRQAQLDLTLQRLITDRAQTEVARANLADARAELAGLNCEAIPAGEERDICDSQKTQLELQIRQLERIVRIETIQDLRLEKIIQALQNLIAQIEADIQLILNG